MCRNISNETTDRYFTKINSKKILTKHHIVIRPKFGLKTPNMLK